MVFVKYKYRFGIVEWAYFLKESLFHSNLKAKKR